MLALFARAAEEDEARRMMFVLVLHKSLIRASTAILRFSPLLSGTPDGSTDGTYASKGEAPFVHESLLLGTISRKGKESADILGSRIDVLCWE